LQTPPRLWPDLTLPRRCPPIPNPRSLPVAGTPPAESGPGGPYGVVLLPSLPYGPGHRQLLDVYVPLDLYRQRGGAAGAGLGGGNGSGSGSSSSGSGGKAGGSKAGGGEGSGGARGSAATAPVVFFVHGGIWATGGGPGRDVGLRLWGGHRCVPAPWQLSCRAQTRLAAPPQATASTLRRSQCGWRSRASSSWVRAREGG
jgi:hypothetical protein